MLVGVFEKFRENCLEIYRPNPSNFLPATRLAWQACLKNTEVKWQSLTNIHMLLMIQEGIIGGIYQ